MRTSRLSRVSCLATISLLVVGALLAGCTGGVTGFDTLGTVSSESVASEAAFQQTLWKWVNTQGCVQCHGGSTPEPPFASADLDIAFATATGNEIGTTTPMIDFSDPDSSIFIEYAGNAHCGVGACSDATVRPVVQALLEQWAAVEVANGHVGAAGPRPTYMSPSVPVPANIPFTTSPTVMYMSFPLSGLQPPVASLANAVLQVQIQLISSGEYRFTNPRLIGNTSVITISGLHVFLAASTDAGSGGQDESQGLTWVNVVAQLGISTLLPNLAPNTVFNTPVMTSASLDAVVLSTSSTGTPADKITIGIDSVSN